MTRAAAAPGLVVLVSLLGCVAHPKAYPGPTRSISEIGVVTGGSVEEFRQKFVVITRVDGRDAIEEWKGDRGLPVHLLPGIHQFRVKFRQLTLTSMPLVGLVASVQDAASAFAHPEMTIVFPVSAGMIHGIHYLERTNLFMVSRGPSDVPLGTMPLVPTEDAVACTAQPDRTGALWCELQSDLPAAATSGQ